MRLTVNIFFPDNREAYTDLDGRVWKLDDYRHWEQWVKQALWNAQDSALIRCAAKLDVHHSPIPQRFRVRCPKCGEYAEVILRGACDIEIPIRRYAEDGYIVPDWEGAYVEDPREGECEYICSECENKIFDNIEQIEEYLKVHGEGKDGSLEER